MIDEHINLYILVRLVENVIKARTSLCNVIILFSNGSLNLIILLILFIFIFFRFFIVSLNNEYQTLPTI